MSSDKKLADSHDHERPVPPSPSAIDALQDEKPEEGVDLILPLAIIISALITAGAVIYGARTVSSQLTDLGNKLNAAPTLQAQANPTPAQPEDKQVDPNKRYDVAIGPNPILGNESAPVTIIEFSDAQCPFCKRFHDQTFPQLKSEYIDTGKVKLAYRSFPLSIHPDAPKAAEAQSCARDQDKFWELTEEIFVNQGAMKVADIKKMAANIGMNPATFDECLDSGKYKSEVDKDFADGSAAGVSGTPSFFVNGKILVGAQPFTAFQALIDQELAG
jgi:protein-disulfide isomerase